MEKNPRKKPKRGLHLKKLLLKRHLPKPLGKDNLLVQLKLVPQSGSKRKLWKNQNGNGGKKIQRKKENVKKVCNLSSHLGLVIFPLGNFFFNKVAFF